MGKIGKITDKIIPYIFILIFLICIFCCVVNFIYLNCIIDKIILFIEIIMCLFMIYLCVLDIKKDREVVE